MLQNAYFLAKIGADTAENEQHFAEILPTDGLWRLRLGATGYDNNFDWTSPSPKYSKDKDERQSKDRDAKGWGTYVKIKSKIKTKTRGKLKDIWNGFPQFLVQRMSKFLEICAKCNRFE